MSKSLIIAEKPSVATDIARALGGFTRHDDYFESSDFVLSSAVGHLIEIGMPEEEEVKRGKWTFAHLPAIPSQFALKPIEKNENRLKTILRLMKRKDVTALINACDAGREGELIFRYIAQFAKSEKPIRRLWLQSMTTNAIRDVLALDEPQQRAQPVLVLLDRLQREFRRNGRQMREGPLAALHLLLFGHPDLEEVSDRGRHHVVGALEVVVVPREAAERPRDVGGDGRLLGNDQRFGHEAGDAKSGR